MTVVSTLCIFLQICCYIIVIGRFFVVHEVGKVKTVKASSAEAKVDETSTSMSNSKKIFNMLALAAAALVEAASLEVDSVTQKQI